MLADALENPHEGGPCQERERERCLERLEKDIALLFESGEFPVEAAILRARYLLLVGRASQADDFLAGRCVELQATPACWRKRVDAALATRDDTRVERAMAAYLNVACTGNRECARAAVSMGDILAQGGDWPGALKYYGRAVREAPSRANWSRLSRAAREANQPLRAREADLRARQAHFEEP